MPDRFDPTKLPNLSQFTVQGDDDSRNYSLALSGQWEIQTLPNGVNYSGTWPGHPKVGDYRQVAWDAVNGIWQPKFWQPYEQNDFPH